MKHELARTRVDKLRPHAPTPQGGGVRIAYGRDQHTAKAAMGWSSAGQSTKAAAGPAAGLAAVT
ncbi:hypothetical protein [Planctellipticum variicoloris]|uniref:hypothetical protein n=1 Tax=Planctellipticum variicoloris TaxID=3064265 RepID=UPI002C9BBF80|nr:hypothetical protein SH412_005633 [Planctomycetaceae bacterium SH412]HTN00848.1 hypothetical protein [Planctomycetaceae bacterium]